MNRKNKTSILIRGRENRLSNIWTDINIIEYFATKNGINNVRINNNYVF